MNKYMMSVLMVGALAGNVLAMANRDRDLNADGGYSSVSRESGYGSGTWDARNSGGHSGNMQTNAADTMDTNRGSIGGTGSLSGAGAGAYGSGSAATGSMGTTDASASTLGPATGGGSVGSTM